MRIIALKVLLLGLLLSSCSTNELKNEIQNIWVGTYEQVLYFDDEESMYGTLPILIDLTDPNNAIIKDFVGGEINTSWDLKDSILTFESVDYRIISITKDSITYSPNLTPNSKPKEEPIREDSVVAVAVPEKDRYFVLKKLERKKLNIDNKEIAKILSNSLCSNSSSKVNTIKYGDRIEFFDNGIAIFKTNTRADRTYLQEESWKIESYKGFSFLVFYHNWYQNNGFMNNAYQIIGLSESELTLKGFIKDTIHYQLERNDKKPTKPQKLTGKWNSKNDITKFYTKYLPQIDIQEGRVKLYDDTLVYMFYKDSLIISGKDFEPINCKWRLNYDTTILIFEYSINQKEFNGVHVEYANISKLSESYFELELFDNQISTFQKKQRKIMLNRNQVFWKVE